MLGPPISADRSRAIAKDIDALISPDDMIHHLTINGEQLLRAVLLVTQQLDTIGCELISIGVDASYGTGELKLRVRGLSRSDSERLVAELLSSADISTARVDRCVVSMSA